MLISITDDFDSTRLSSYDGHSLVVLGRLRLRLDAVEDARGGAAVPRQRLVRDEERLLRTPS